MHIRHYQPKDREACLGLIRLHIPEYFAESEADDFAIYLDREREDYFVLESEDSVLGCGGINYPSESQTARLSWDMIHPDHFGKGYGRALVRHRLDHIVRLGGYQMADVRTSQLTAVFYRRQGFMLKEVKKDFWAEGLDLYHMEMELDSTLERKD